MLNNIRKFAKTKFAGLLVGILIVPFVLWGMGGVFSGGNTNNIAKINKKNISTKDFMDFINLSNLDTKTIKENIDNNILEEYLAKLISSTMLEMEIKNFNIIISDKTLKKIIEENINFKDENNKFSRSKYEKHLLLSNISHNFFELSMKDNELKKAMRKYISGGTKPPNFLVNKNFREQTKQIEINYIDLSNVYKKKDSFTIQEVKEFINKNEEILKEKVISFKYSKIFPKDLIGINEFNNLFFEKIDEMENEILNGKNIEDIKTKYNLIIEKEENYKINKKSENKSYFEKIYNNEELNKVQLIEEKDFYLIYEIYEINKILPSINNQEFVSKINEMLFNENKYDLYNDLIKKIGSKEFSKNDFYNISKENSTQIKTEKISSISDNKKFTEDSIKYLYTLSKNNYGLIGDKDKNIYLIQISNIDYKSLTNKISNLAIYEYEENEKIKDSIYDSYDFFLNSKYKVKINEKTLERVKNYFK